MSTFMRGDYEEIKKGVLRDLLDGSFQKIFVKAWKGVGATALLREVAEAVETRGKGEFETVIKVVRPAPFGNPREMQRAVAEQLNLLSPSVTAAFDDADEDDDFWGEEFSSRDMVPKVKMEIYRAVKDHKVLLVLYNNIADAKLIDPNDLGILITKGLINNAAMWTSGMNISMEEAASASADFSATINSPNEEAALDLVYKEAVEIARYIDKSSAAVKYFVCDGILQGDDAAAWEIGKALAPLIGPIVNDQLLQYWQKELTSTTWTPRGKNKELLPPKTLLIDSTTQRDWAKFSSPSSSKEEESSYRWISVRSPQTNIPEPWDFFFKEYRGSVLSDVSSVFWHFKKTHEVALPDSFFDHFSNVRVLELLGCVVSPIGHSSFLRLRNLRMLRLERCKVITKQCSVDPTSLSLAQEEQREPIFFDNLWVLNLYNSDADAFLLAGKPFELTPNLLELDLTYCKGLEYLNFNLPATIETISLQRCASLKAVELVDPAEAPLPNLNTFRLSGSKLIAKLSLRGCHKLENVDLQELMGLEVLDLSCTAIKVVDISKLPQLKQLFLLGCEQLRRVAGLDKGPRLDVLYLDNYNGGDACDVDRCLDSFRNQRPSELTKGTNDADQRLLHAHMVVKDVRLFRSLHYAFPAALSRAKSCFHIHIKGSSTAKRGTNIGTTTRSALCYADVLNTMTDRHRRHHPSPPAMPLNNHIEVDGGHDSRIVEEIPFWDIMTYANSLFIHDNTSNFNMGIQFSDLKYFRIERCPNLEFIFHWSGAADSVESIWLSQLPRLKALHEYGRIRSGQLKHIYLEFCARLEYVLPSVSELHDLETINIRYCGDLKAIFNERGAAPQLLPKLTSIHLQELPKLQHIYKPNICAPSLEEIKVMGCFNLEKLPLFGRSDARSMRGVKINCEKDWWDKLQWDGLESNHHSSLFNPKHCPYYKKRMKATYL
uniref:Disease resistance protein At4g27190-like leucine-rich repeats domain-containing protein n=1 Tax=Ananas comosus var. bracteatus TaxID=296719 RepID=A0A6V7NI31_ANACO|nr:unnamed protein product [Ananas comosus var. bracteatus]